MFTFLHLYGKAVTIVERDVVVFKVFNSTKIQLSDEVLC